MNNLTREEVIVKLRQSLGIMEDPNGDTGDAYDLLEDILGPQISKEEKWTRTKIEEYRDAKEWSQYRQVLLMMWRREFHAALELDRICKLTQVLGNFVDSPEASAIRNELSNMVRWGLLRSYVKGGRRLWELNY